MDSIKDFFIELGSQVGEMVKEIIFGFKKGLKIHLDLVIEIFNKVKERCLTD